MPTERNGYGNLQYGLGDYGTSGTVKDGAVSITATSTFSASGGRNLESSATASATSSVPAFSADRIRESSGALSASATVTASGESIIIERSDKLPWGSGLYGYNRYDLNDLQTIVSVTSAVSVANGNRVRGSDSTVTATSSTTASAEIIKLGASAVAATSGSTANAVYTIKGSGTASASGSVIINYIRRRVGSASSTGTSGTLSIGREKWEPIPVTSITWSNVA